MGASASNPSRLRWRCRRGMRELDVLLGDWLSGAWPGASAGLKDDFEALLDEEDDRIWDWLMGRALPPDALSAIVAAVRDYRSSLQSGV